MTAWIPDWSLFAVAVPAALFAGISKGGFGSGAAFAASAMIAVVMEPVLALGVMLPLLMVIDVLTVGSFWKGWHMPSAQAMILGGLPGVAFGAWFSTSVDPDVLRFLIGAIAVLFVVWHWAGARGWLPSGEAKFRWSGGIVTGIVAGFTSFVSHAGGPPVAVFLLAQRLDKTVYQATTAITFWAINIFKAVPYAFLGFFTAETLVLDLWLAPIAAFGTYLGVKAHHFVPQPLFFAITYVLLMTTGSKLIFDALT